MFKYFFFSCIVLLFVLFYCPIVKAQTAIVDAINKHLISLQTLNPDSDYTDLQPLKSFLAGKEMIGEATHGTHEFFEFKHRMLEFLVKQIGVKVFVIEGDFGGTQTMNDYVLYGKGDVKKGLSGIGFGVWMTQEVVDMCNWLRDYNATQTVANKVRFYGCDMQWGFSAMQLLKDYLNPAGKFTPQMELALTALKKPANITESGLTTIKAAVDTLAKMQFVNGDTALYRHDVHELRQYIKYVESKSTFFPARQSDWRDKCMAENCEWIHDYTGQRMMIWAHNAHVSKSAGSESMQRMGMYLAKDMGSKYYAMGFDFYEGQMRSFDMQLKQYVSPQIPASKNGSSGAFFAQCNTPNFIIDINSTLADEPATADFFNKKIPSIFLGPSFNPKTGIYYITHQLSKTYDAVIFLKETTAAISMK